jgi:hypothetical protein
MPARDVLHIVAREKKLQPVSPRSWTDGYAVSAGQMAAENMTEAIG